MAYAFPIVLQPLQGRMQQGAAIDVCASPDGTAPGADAVSVNALGKECMARLLTMGGYRRDIY
jgi:hypothetical protein